MIKLSLCIPTYNRSKLLEQLLDALIPQITELESLVELIISDNCSNDNTHEVIENFKDKFPIKYYRNNENLGAVKNIQILTNELAKGEFVWLLGDDDLVNKNGIKKVLSVIEKYHDVDYIFVNALIKTPEEREITYLDNTSKNTLLRTKGKRLEDKKNIKFDKLIDPEVDDVFLGSLMCSIFRLSVWRNYTLNLHGEIYSSLEQTYPHSVVFAHTMIGRKAYYIGYPCVIAFWGQQEWINSYLPLIVGVRLQELLDLYLSLGVDKKRINKCRRFLLGYSQGALNRLLLDKTALGREYFSLITFIKRNKNYKLKVFIMLIKSTRYLIIKNLPKPIYRFLKGLRNKIIGLILL